MQAAQTATAPAASSSRARRRLVPIVDARFQWKYTLLIAALGVGVTAIMGGFLYRAHVTNTRVLELGANEELRRQVAQNDQLFLLYLVVLVVAMAVILSLWGIIVTHRISGPLYLVARYLGVLGSGSYPDMRPLRKRDELHTFFAAFEEAVNNLKARDAETLREIDEAVSGARKNADADAAKEALIAVLQKQRDAIAKAIGKGEGAPVE